MAVYGPGAIYSPILFDLHSIFLNGKFHIKKKYRFLDFIGYQEDLVTLGSVSIWHQ